MLKAHQNLLEENLNKLSYYIKEKELKNIHKIYEFKDSVKIFKKVINKKYLQNNF